MKYLLISIILFNLFNTEKIIESNKTNDIIVNKRKISWCKKFYK